MEDRTDLSKDQDQPHSARQPTREAGEVTVQLVLSQTTRIDIAHPRFDSDQRVIWCDPERLCRHLGFADLKKKKGHFQTAL